jgi:hypothetical protein
MSKSCAEAAISEKRIEGVCLNDLVLQQLEAALRAPPAAVLRFIADAGAFAQEVVMLRKIMVALAIALALGSSALSTTALARGRGGGFGGGGFGGGHFSNYGRVSGLRGGFHDETDAATCGATGAPTTAP